MSICGGHFIGGFVPLDGTIRDLRAVASVAGADITWSHDGVTEPFHRLAVALDGDLVAVLPAGTDSTTVTGFPPGEHRIDVYPIRADVRRIPDLHGDPYGDRAYLSWPASPSDDLAAYLVYMDDVLAGTVTGAFVQPLFAAPATSGTGDGLLTVSGSWTGAAVNRVATIAITAEGFTHDLAGSPVFVADFAQGDEFDLPYGIRVRFDSARADYDAGDEFEFRTGPKTSWASGAIAAGTHSFTVRGRDVAGNVSEPLDEREIVIFGRPAPVSALAAAWTGTQIALSWNAPDDPGEHVASILIFSNYSPTFGRLMDRIVEDSPFATKAADAVAHTFTPSVQGVWRFQAVTTHDEHSGRGVSAELAEVDTEDIPTSVHLNVPEQIDVLPALGGELLVRWRYNTDEGEDASEFRVYVSDTEELPDFEEAPEAVVAVGTADPGGFVDGEVSLGPYGGERWFVVRASNGTVETQNTDLHSGVPDDEAPTMEEPLLGVPN